MKLRTASESVGGLGSEGPLDVSPQGTGTPDPHGAQREIQQLREALRHVQLELEKERDKHDEEAYNDAIAANEQLRADVARLRHLAHQLIEQWRASEKHSRDNLDFNSRHGNIQDDDYPNALKACADELDAALTEPPA